MAKKPTYEDLEQRIKKLETEVLTCNGLEEEHENIFNFSLDMIGSGNLEGSFTKINSSFGEILGYTKEEFLNKPFLSFVHQEDIKKTSEALADAGKGKRAIFIENRYKCKDGSHKWIEWKVQILIERNQFIAVGRDITERKQIEEELKKHQDHLEGLVSERTKELQKVNEELRESEKIYRSFLDMSPDPIVIAQDGYLKFINQAHADLFGYTAQDIDKGLSIKQCISAKDQEKVEKRIAERLSGKEPEPKYNTLDIISKEGKRIPCEASGNAIQYNGRPADLSIIRDITERKQAQKALAFEREQLLSIFDSIDGGVYVSDIDTHKILYVGRTTKDTFQKELIGELCYRELQGLDSPCEFCTNEIIRKQAPEPYRWEIHNPILDKDYAIVDRIIKWPDGRDVRFEIALDITERKQAEDALRQSEEKYKSIFENVAVSIILVDANGQMLDVNPYHITNIGKGKIKKEDLLAHNFFTYPSVVSGGVSERLKSVLEGKLVTFTEHYYPTTSGGIPGYFNTRAVPLFADGEVSGAVIMFEDITTTKRSEELIRDLSHQIIRSQENERQIISRELHDQVAQDLSALKINCEMLLGYKSLSSGIRNHISGISDRLREILKAVRDLSYDLRPPGLEKLGLIGTLNRYCKDFSRENGIHIEFLSAGMDNLRLKFEANINLYRLVQEGLNNVRKHADADNATIKLISSFPNIILRIEDDGKGFDMEERLTAAYKEKRMGIRSMKERVEILQGKMSIESISGKGTKILIEIPYKNKAHEAK